MLPLMSPQERVSRLNENWAGITDAALRKKLQNRINQRALPLSGARKRDKKRALIAQQQAKSNDKRHYALILPRPDPDSANQGTRKLLLPRPTSLSGAVAMMMSFHAAAYERYYAADPCLDHLLTLSKMNVLRAFVDIMGVLGWDIHAIEDNETVSPFTGWNLQQQDKETSIPLNLLPTTTQCSVPHHPWFDCFPFPQMRDNLITAGEGFDDCELCEDMMDPTNGDIGIMVWGDPWLPQSWEVSELFVQKWAWVMKGCQELLVSSNYWRARRGLDELDVSTL
ncbi:hypothetical protein ASPTUDRAFT_63799 [Aspergillus tubingensis CBS 134.48]|uniref:BZIP domain-containing protein n=1 Tax=Aspergillus tubingensis (strain CBS 134.48) TaxID=767770 RepID=A0A1L9NAL4_ASPTC|nr:hypothetical protein ASPTUDRAFT_63799 [Aspergillus tubingensis CBS 134.48]